MHQSVNGSKLIVRKFCENFEHNSSSEDCLSTDENTTDLLLDIVIDCLFDRDSINTHSHAENNDRNPYEPCLMLAEFDPKIEPSYPATDSLLHKSIVRFVLENPCCFVLLVVLKSREEIGRDLKNWIEFGPHQNISSEKKFQNLAQLRPFSWSLITLDEIQSDAIKEWRARGVTIRHCAEQAIYDPTGLRTFVSFSVQHQNLGQNVQYLPPQSAIVVDDERESCRDLAYVSRRLGMSSFVVDSKALWDLIASNPPKWAGFSDIDLAIVDNVLGFDRSLGEGGHACLREWDVKFKIFVTGADSEERCVITKPVLDCYTLQSQMSNVPVCSLFAFNENLFATRYAGHDLSIRFLREIGHHLYSQAETLLQQGNRRYACIFLIEAYQALQTRDEGSAARAWIKLHEIELGHACEVTSDQVREFWDLRQAELGAGIKRAFVNPNGRKASLWTARAFSSMIKVLNDHPAQFGTIQQAETAYRDARIKLYEHDKQMLQARSWRILNWFTSKLDSLGKVADVWLFLQIVVLWTYFAWGIHIPYVAPDWPIVAKQYFATFFGGFGLLSPESIGLGLPMDLHHIVSLLHRVASVLLFGRAVQLFFSLTKT